MKVKNDHRSKFSDLSNWKEESLKKIRASTGFEPVTSANTGAIIYQLSLDSISAALSCLVCPPSGEERGLISRTAAGNRA